MSDYYDDSVLSATQDERDKYRAQRDKLLAALKDAQDAMDERRDYCEMWEYKYRDRWNEEDADVAEAIKEVDES